MAEDLYYPMIVSWELTNACNLRCLYCFNNSGIASSDELKKQEIVEGLRELYSAGVFRVEFTGGEPMMRPDFDEIIKEAHDMDFIISIASNGTLINRNRAAAIKRAEAAYVQISLDGLNGTNDFHKGVSGAFDRAVEGIKCLKEQDIPVHTRITVTKKNCSEIEGLINFAQGLGVDEFNVMRMWPSGRGLNERDIILGADETVKLNKEMLRLQEVYDKGINIKFDHCSSFERDSFKAYKEKDQIICQCGKTSCVIKPNGIVSPCEILTMSAGNLREQKFEDIWKNSKVMEEFRSFNVDNLKGACAKCSDRKVCGGNCRALALIHYGDFYAEDPTCWKVMKSKAAE